MTLVVACSLLVPICASADWKVYTQLGIGFSHGITDASGRAPVAGNNSFDDDFQDTAPALGGSLGLSIPLSELTPWKLPFDLRIPDWPLRLETEAIGLRNYEGRSDSPSAQFDQFTEVEAWSLMWNGFQDVPLRAFRRKSSGVSGRSTSLLRTLIDNTTWYYGVGIGMSSSDFTSSDNRSEASDTIYNFAWMAATGFGYRLTEFMFMDVGYRYFDAGGGNADLKDLAGVSAAGPFSIDQESHEVWVKLRLNLHHFRNPWLLLPH